MFKEFIVNSEETNEVIGSLQCHLNLNKDSSVIKNYFYEKHRVSDIKLNRILSNCSERVTILMNMNVSESHRGLGFSNYLLELLNILICKIP